MTYVTQLTQGQCICHVSPAGFESPFDTVSMSTSVTDWTMRHMTSVQIGDKNKIGHVIQCEEDCEKPSPFLLLVLSSSYYSSPVIGPRAHMNSKTIPPLHTGPVRKCVLWIQRCGNNRSGVSDQDTKVVFSVKGAKSSTMHRYYNQSMILMCEIGLNVAGFNVGFNVTVTCMHVLKQPAHTLE
ncbi:hypothetical protein F2P81_013662 [Scophthalmus maximus]|uniref:Uncharacterized protein n=1 Tax=Scophthalmus maximus TaxID=52904 RepID=A0A6A4SEM7_SCOMX|nr:hypothetical protein F2P81_013662 [Scophthalmus maximus]